MKKLNEFATIKNLNTDATTVIDDEGNIEELEGDGDAFSFGFDDSATHSLRPDGSHDGLDDEYGDDFDDEFSDEFDGMGDPFGAEAEGGELSAEEAPLDGEGEFEEGGGMFGEEEPTEEGDPDFQGVIRTVTGACLVYKRKTEEGTYEELWIYNVGKNMRNEVKTRRAILAGTDIPVQGVSSEDGTQNIETTTIGNVQYLRVTGLPN